MSLNVPMENEAKKKTLPSALSLFNASCWTLTFDAMEPAQTSLHCGMSTSGVFSFGLGRCIGIQELVIGIAPFIFDFPS